MKKHLLKLVIFAAIFSNIIANVTATNFISCTNNSQCGKNEICYQKKCRPLLDALTERPGEDSNEIVGKYPETKTIGNLPEVTLESGVTTVIKTILGWSMILTIAAIVAASTYYLTSRGKEEDITKAKDIILYLIIGIAIMAAAYGIVTGISQFDFFE